MLGDLLKVPRSPTRGHLEISNIEYSKFVYEYYNDQMLIYPHVKKRKNDWYICKIRKEIVWFTILFTPYG